MTHRSYVFTVNNPPGLLDFEALSEKEVRYLIYQEEAAPDTGTHHFQGYMELKKPMRLRQVSRLPGFEHAHLEPRRGTRTEARDYAKKDDPSKLDGPYEYGDFQAGGAGARNDYATLKKLVDSGADDKKIWDEVPDLFLRHSNVLSRARLFSIPQRDFKTKVYVLWGPPGLGKSYWCKMKSPQAYWKPRGTWWDGYQSTRDVVLDDFRGWLPFDTLLRLCDAYPMQVEIKGSTVDFAPPRLFITSNLHPQLWYKKEYPFPAFARRVNKWYMWTAARAYTRCTWDEGVGILVDPSHPPVNPDNNHVM